MKDRDPPRFLDESDTPPVLRDALTAARSRAPSDADLARIAARLPKPGDPGLGGGASGGAPKAPPIASGSTLSGAAIGAGLGVLVVGASLIWQAVHEVPAPSSQPAAVGVTASPAPSTMTTSLSAPIASAGSRSASPPAASAARGIERPAVASAAPATSADPEAPARIPEPTATAPAALVADAIDTETEAHFLDRARAALDAAPAQALSLTDEHARRFPSGALGQESEVVAIQALSRLGRAAEARARAQRFLAAFPGSVHRRRLEALIAP